MDGGVSSSWFAFSYGQLGSHGQLGLLQYSATYKLPFIFCSRQHVRALFRAIEERPAAASGTGWVYRCLTVLRSLRELSLVAYTYVCAIG